MLFLRRQAGGEHRRSGRVRTAAHPKAPTTDGVVCARRAAAPGGPEPQPRERALAAEAQDSPPSVRVFLHPGRRHVSDMEVSRACEQLRVDWTRTFVDIEEAERACSGLSGFLVEASQPFVDERGNRHGRGVVFAKGLR